VEKKEKKSDGKRILCIESATGVCSVALCDRGGVIAILESGDERAHSKLLATYVSDILQSTGTEASQLAAVAVSRGPGSYTGLRIGVSLAKGLAFGASVPLIAVDTLLSMFYALTGSHPGIVSGDPGTLFCPMIDARRMEVYYSLIDYKGTILREPAAEIVEKGFLAEQMRSHRIVFFGDGSVKCRELITNPAALFAEGAHTSASGMRIPAFEAYSKGMFEDVAYFEPRYLKEFLATTPRKLIP
jgi:tRNA threonylcarbamoyladenosine biosynthesis protein TsaB